MISRGSAYQAPAQIVMFFLVSLMACLFASCGYLEDEEIVSVNTLDLPRSLQYSSTAAVASI